MDFQEEMCWVYWKVPIFSVVFSPVNNCFQWHRIKLKQNKTSGYLFFTMFFFVQPRKIILSVKLASLLFSEFELAFRKTSNRNCLRATEGEKLRKIKNPIQNSWIMLSLFVVIDFLIDRKVWGRRHDWFRGMKGFCARLTLSWRLFDVVWW